MLRGAGAAMALPWLESMLPAQAAPKPPIRAAWVYVPHGMPMNLPKPNIPTPSHLWTPKAAGEDYAPSRILEPLMPHRKDFLVLSGLAHNRKEIPDDTNRHSQEVAIFLTGHSPKRSLVPDVGGPSVDQVAAEKIGHLTRLPSLEIGTTRGESGVNQSGYSGAYDNNISWRSRSIPMGKEANPLLLFERLYRRGGSSDQKAVLDLVLEDAKSLSAKLGTADRRRLDEYLEGVRGIEKRLAAVAKFGDRDAAPAPELPDLQYGDADSLKNQLPALYKGLPAEYDDHVRLMIDLLVVAFQTDTTRLATFMLSHPQAPESRQYSRRHVDLKGAWHDHAHKAFEPNGEPSMEEMVKVSRYHCGLFAHLLERFKSVKEGDGTLLDHSMVLYGGGLGNGGTHFLWDLPILLAGRAGGTLKPGRHVDYDQKKRTPLSNLYVEMLARLGAPVEKFGVSDGPLPGLV
jgi:hypothetical protein